MPYEANAPLAAADEDVPIDAGLRDVWRRRLVSELGSIGTQARGTQARARAASDELLQDPGRVDSSDQQALETERDVDLLLVDESGTTAEAIREALERLDEGSFGQCIDCGGRIAIARLTALPYASRCLDCQARAERRR